MNTLNRLTWALPSGFDWDTEKFAKQVKTKAWVNKFKRNLSTYADRLTSVGADDAKIIKQMLESAYGVNIGGQVFDKIKPQDYEKIKWNIIKSQYE